MWWTVSVSIARGLAIRAGGVGEGGGRSIESTLVILMDGLGASRPTSTPARNLHSILTYLHTSSSHTFYFPRLNAGFLMPAFFCRLTTANLLPSDLLCQLWPAFSFIFPLPAVYPFFFCQVNVPGFRQLLSACLLLLAFFSQLASASLLLSAFVCLVRVHLPDAICLLSPACCPLTAFLC